MKAPDPFEEWSWTLRPSVAGVDEAGRGPLAGPVVAAAVLGLEEVPKGLGDSKRLTAQQRWLCFWELWERAKAIGIGLASPAEIDRLNILQASLLAMRRALARLPYPPDVVLVDGPSLLPSLPYPQRALVRGDACCPPIAAASVVAKVVRDLIMERLDRLFPGYGFARHKGYPTLEHLEQLARLGPSPVHRRTFGPVRRILEGNHGEPLAMVEALARPSAPEAGAEGGG